MYTKGSMPLFACLLLFTGNLVAIQAMSTWPSFKTTNISAAGVAGPRPVVWFDDPDFSTLLAPRSPLQLIDRSKTPCPLKCEACDASWKVTREGLQTALFFKDPVQISKIFVKQVRNSGLVKVQFLKWVYPPAGRVDATTLGATVWNVTDDTSMCQSVEVVRVTNKVSGINKAVPSDGSQQELPASLAKTATGGVVITMKIPDGAASNYGPFVEYVRFAGRVLYPNDPSIYPAPLTKLNK